MIFSDCAILVRDSVDPSSISGNTPYIGLEHIEQSTLKYAKTGVASEVFSNKNKYLSGDILFGKLRPYFRKVIRVDIDGICSTDIWVIRPKEGIDSRFLFYWCASDQFVRSLTKASVGTKMPRAKWEVAERLEVPNHSFKEQQAIGQVLGALDCKIDKNREMVGMLVEIANSLFNSWFVDYEPVKNNNTFPPSPPPPHTQVQKMSNYKELKNYFHLILLTLKLD